MEDSRVEGRGSSPSVASGAGTRGAAEVRLQGRWVFRTSPSLVLGDKDDWIDLRIEDVFM